MKRRLERPLAKDPSHSVPKTLESLPPLMGDPVPEFLDMGREQQAAFQPPSQAPKERRVQNDEADQSRTR